MIFQELDKLINNLRNNIKIYKKYLNEDPDIVREVIVEPLLNSLGWNPGNPSIVKPIRGDRSYMYILYSRGSPIAVVEILRLVDSVVSNFNLIKELFYNYNTKYIIRTNGADWIIYNIDKFNVKILSKFNIINDNKFNIINNLVFIWGLHNINNIQNISLSNNFIKKNIITNINLYNRNKYPLSSLSRYGNNGKKPPRKIIFPDYSSIDIRYWRDILVNIVKWLFDNNYITIYNLPITKPTWNRYIVASRPFHDKLSKSFINPVKIYDNLYVETHWSADDIISISQYLTDEYGPGSDKFYLEL